MAKKSAPSRPAARKPAASGKQTAVALVRAPRPENGASSSQSATAPLKSTAATEAARVTATPPAPSTPKAEPRSVVVTPAERPRVPEVKAARPVPAPRAEVAATRPTQASRVQATSLARARAVQRARAAHAISPEQYGYVLKDLRLIITLAISMFAIIVILHFALPQ
jgi:hypothetical protein